MHTEQLNRIEAAIHNLFRYLKHELEKIMASQAELTVEVNAIKTQLVKIGGETTTLLTKINELLAVIAASPVSPELQAAVDALKAQAQVVDDLVPDAPTP